MLKFKRPDIPDGFDDKSKKKLRAYQEAKSKGDKAEIDTKFWGEYKDSFFAAQYNKCGYCETKITESYGDMEHYRPKSVVEVLSDEKDTWGKEQEPKNNVKGRIFDKGCEEGYWWLAYSWDNYLLSCGICNQPWKRALFPIVEIRQANISGAEFPFISPKKEDEETPLVLNPFDDSKKISEHFSFTKAGLIKPKNDSKYGFETIRTCGLDRPSIVDARSEKAGLVNDHIVEWLVTNNNELDKSLAKTILKFGNEEHQFAGMVRIIFENLIEDITWDEFEEMYKE